MSSRWAVSRCLDDGQDGAGDRDEGFEFAAALLRVRRGPKGVVMAAAGAAAPSETLERRGCPPSCRRAAPELTGGARDVSPGHQCPGVGSRACPVIR